MSRNIKVISNTLSNIITLDTAKNKKNYENCSLESKNSTWIVTAYIRIYDSIIIYAVYKVRIVCYYIFIAPTSQ